MPSARKAAAAGYAPPEATPAMLTPSVVKPPPSCSSDRSDSSKGLVYNCFPTRDALLATLLHREQTELRDLAWSQRWRRRAMRT